MGLAARLASKMYVFERGCFTTAGLETVMQVINMVNDFYAFVSRILLTIQFNRAMQRRQKTKWILRAPSSFAKT